MSYVSLKELKEQLKDVPKAILIKMLHNHVGWKSTQDIEIMVLDTKLLLNLQHQEQVLLKSADLLAMETLNMESKERAIYHAKLEYLNHEFAKLSEEYQRFDKKKEQLQQTN